MKYSMSLIFNIIRTLTKGIIVVVVYFFWATYDVVMNPKKVSWPKVVSSQSADEEIEQKVLALLNKMSLEQKVAQMIQAEIRHIQPSDLKDYPLGSILNGGGSFPKNKKRALQKDWLELADSFYVASINSGAGIPILWGTDAVHGHNNVFGATIFPHNIGLGATQNPELLHQIARITTKEVMATGIDWIFSPTVAVARNDAWGRTYESYSENPNRVKALVPYVVEGIQGKLSTNQYKIGDEYLIATLKHFIADGGTKDGVDQGDSLVSEKELRDIHAQGYIEGLQSGAQVVMASFSSWRGKKMHAHSYLLTKVLKEQMGFDGFVVGDWNGHGQIPECTNKSCPKAINAGVDMIMVPEDWKDFYHNTLKQVKQGIISLDRINDAVTRILRVKLRYQIFSRPRPSERKIAKMNHFIGRQEHRKVAREAARQSMVLLKNKKNILPLDTTQKHLLITGDGADNISMQTGGWTLTWQGSGNTNEDFPGATSIRKGLVDYATSQGLSVEYHPEGLYQKKPDVAIVVFGEQPYAEGQGDLKDLDFTRINPRSLELLKKLHQDKIKIISVFLTGRPLWMNPLINLSDAFVVAWLLGSEGQALADLIFSIDQVDFKGTLPMSWPKYADAITYNEDSPREHILFPEGFGLNYTTKKSLYSDKELIGERKYLSSGTKIQSDELIIFRGRSSRGISSYIRSHLMNQSMKLKGDMGESEDALIKVSVLDKEIQEDSRLISWLDQSEKGTYFFEADKAINLADFYEKGVLSFSLMLENNATDPSKLFIQFGGKKISLEAFFNSDLLYDVDGERKWFNVEIALKCLVSSSEDLTKVTRLLGFESLGQNRLGYSKIKISKREDNNIMCAGALLDNH